LTALLQAAGARRWFGNARDGEHAAVVFVVRADAELGEDARDVCLDGLSLVRPVAYR
jgi:hypothetical protein